jgi:hypothetical protein
MTPDGKKLLAILQDPLQQEGNATGVFSRNVRIVQYDVRSGMPEAQYIYQLEAVADINARLSANRFADRQQGRNIGV